MHSILCVFMFHMPVTICIKRLTGFTLTQMETILSVIFLTLYSPEFMLYFQFEESCVLFHFLLSFFEKQEIQDNAA